MAKQRIYKVQHGDDVRLVKAGVKAQAVRHIADKIISAEVASQDDLVRLLGEGKQVEQASADQETAELPGMSADQPQDGSGGQQPQNADANSGENSAPEVDPKPRSRRARATVDA